MTCPPQQTGRRRVWLIARDVHGREVDSIEVTGPNAGTDGTQSGVEMGDGELKEMWHAARSFEDNEVVGMPGSVPGYGHVGVRRWTMKLTTKATDIRSWSQVERRLWTLTTPDQHSGRTGQFFIRFQERNGEAREIQIRRTGTPEPENKTYAGQRGWETWTFEVTAYDPWWYGDPSEDEWENTDGAGSAVLEVENHGDQPGYLIWTIPAAATAQTWTVPDGQGVYPVGHEKAGQRIMHTLPAVGAGDVGEADTRPYRLPFRILGQPMSFGRMRQTRWTHPIPPGNGPDSGPVSLPVSVVGGLDAGIKVSLRPAFDRPHS
ncbi:hypothetical protein K3888_13315 [Dietzia aurantiaca]|uniref:hypothetical protein n=1 Tax=Dietzia aurantiaca TaxID=983873 RepID=UPI001E34133E|nr:hypothetical protein [Dietzia aurantiaca]MCD2263679.1 hypothetical protein [Dietzia aurantiaca]